MSGPDDARLPRLVNPLSYCVHRAAGPGCDLEPIGELGRCRPNRDEQRRAAQSGTMVIQAVVTPPPGRRGGGRAPAAPGPPLPRQRVRGPLVPRERLHRLLDGALERAWVIVSAPAGCGKSSLLQTWVATLTGRAAATVVPEGGLPAYLHGDPSGRPTGEEEGPRRVLVIDHRHPLSKTSWRRLGELTRSDRGTTVVVATRVDPPLPVARLAVAGDLVEVRARDLRWTGSEVRRLLANAGLSLDRNAVELLNARTAGWSAGLTLAIAGMTRAEDPYEFLTRFGDDDHATIEYLAHEVFGALPDRLRELLAATSRTPELTEASAVAVSGLDDAGLLLDHLVDEGLLCTAEGSGALRRYRYHPLLLSLLRRGAVAPGRVARERAAHWHAAHGRPAAAVVDASMSGVHELTARLLLEHGAELLNGPGGRSALEQAFSSLPPDWRDDHPYLLPLSGLRYPLAGDPASASHVLTDAEVRADAGWPVAARYDLLALRAWAAAHGWRDPGRCLADAARMGLAAGSGDSMFSAGVDLARESMLLGRLGILALWHGDPQEAAAYLEAAARSGRAGLAGQPAGRGPDARLGSLTRQAMAHQALLFAVRGQPRTAATVAHEALASTDASAFGSESAGICHLALAWSGYLRGQPAASRLHLARADAAAHQTPEPVPALLAGTLRARLLLVTDGPAAAQTALEPVADAAATAPDWARLLWATTGLRVAALVGETETAEAAVQRLAPAGAEAAFVGAVLALRAGDAGAARRRLRPILVGDLPPLIPWVRVKASLLDAVAAHLLGAGTDAAQGLVRTLVLGAPEELVHPLAELPDTVPGTLALLAAYPEAARSAGAPEYLAVLRTRLPDLAAPPPLLAPAGEAPGSSAAPPRRGEAGGGRSAGTAAHPARRRDPADAALLAGADALTERELEVLALLDSVAPMSRIADRLFVTVNTLKTHVGAIYRKLGADSRADAVERAHAIGLLTGR